MQVNEGVREKENSDRLEWIQNHVQCDGPAEVSAFPSNQGSQYLGYGPVPVFFRFIYTGNLILMKVLFWDTTGIYF